MNSITAHLGKTSAAVTAPWRTVSRIFASTIVYLMELAIKIITTAGRTLTSPFQKVFPSSAPLMPETSVAAIPAARNITATMIMV